MTCTAPTAPTATSPATSGVGGEPADLVGAFRAVASSTWVVTTADGARPVGFTAISVASVSLAPPLLSFNASRTSSSLPALLARRRAAVHLLAEHQEDLARRFAAPAEGRFPPDGSWAWGEDGLPDLAGTAARLTGALSDVVEAGDSLLLLLRVEAGGPRGGAPLVHHGRAYHRVPTVTG